MEPGTLIGTGMLLTIIFAFLALQKVYRKVKRPFDIFDEYQEEIGWTYNCGAAAGLFLILIGFLWLTFGINF